MRYEMDRPLPLEAGQSERAQFIRRTYAHLAGAILAFVAIEAIIFGLLGDSLNVFMRSYFGNPIMQLLVIAGFIGSSYLAQYWARNGGSPAMQYAGLGLYVLIEALIFVPLLYIAMVYLHDYETVGKAGILTLCLFGGLTTVVFTTGKDFSFLGPIIAIASFIALGVILCAMIFGGFGLGLWFSVAMIVLAAAAILYDTSNILLHYRTDQHVAAALSLFSSVAMLFYYILLALLQSRDR
jgi:FtsH-binding integral membrane protein